MALTSGESAAFAWAASVLDDDLYYVADGRHRAASCFHEKALTDRTVAASRPTPCCWVAVAWGFAESRRACEVSRRAGYSHAMHHRPRHSGQRVEARDLPPDEGGFVTNEAQGARPPRLDGFARLTCSLNGLFDVNEKDHHGDSTRAFIWYELMTTDASAAGRFYGAVVGWRIADRSDLQAGGRDYRHILRGDGGSAGGVLQLSESMLAHGAHPAWLAYLQVNDLDGAVRAISEDGGQVLMPKMSLPVGEMAMVTDPLGAPFYVMRPIPPRGKRVAGSDEFDAAKVQHVRWNELQSTDLDRARGFYAKHFGFQFNEAMPMGPHGDYHFIGHGGLRVGGMMQKYDEAAPSGWTFYFGVPSAIAAKRAIEVGGGKVLMDLHEVPGGDWVVVANDPQGAPFGVVGPRGD